MKNQDQILSKLISNIFPLKIIVILIAITLAPNYICFVSNADSAVNVGVDGSIVYQKIDGFGGDPGAISGGTTDNILSMSPTSQKALLDLLFDENKGVGFSIIRFAIAHGFEQSSDNYDITVEKNNVWLINEAHKRGVTTFFGRVGSPPAWMKTNNDLNNGGSVKTTHYDDFAEYLAQWVVDFKSQYGIDITAVSLQNEPDLTATYNSCRWTNAQFHTFIKDYMMPEWKNRGLSTKVIISEEKEWDDSLVIATLNDPATEPFLDIVSAHGYWTKNPSKLGIQSSYPNKTIWQTEENGNFGTIGPSKTDDPSMNDGLFWAERLHDWFTDVEINAWVWHWLTVGKNWGKTWGAKMIEIDGNNYVTAKRLYTIGQYSKFIRPGYYRIDSTPQPESGIKTSAYKDPATGKFAIVAINTNSSAYTLNISLKSLSTSSVTPYTTTDTLNLEASSSIAVSGDEFAATLPAKSVTTFTGTTTDVISNNTVPNPPTKLREKIN